MARVRAAPRRPTLRPTLAPTSAPTLDSIAGEAPPDTLRHGRLGLDPAALRVTWDSQDLPLTATELGLLRTLLSHPGASSLVTS